MIIIIIIIIRQFIRRRNAADVTTRNSRMPTFYQMLGHIGPMRQWFEGAKNWIQGPNLCCVAMGLICRHYRNTSVIRHAIHGSIYRKNRKDIRYLTHNTDTEVSTSVFPLLKNTEYRRLLNTANSVCSASAPPWTNAIFIPVLYTIF